MMEEVKELKYAGIYIDHCGVVGITGVFKTADKAKGSLPLCANDQQVVEITITRKLTEKEQLVSDLRELGVRRAFFTYGKDSARKDIFQLVLKAADLLEQGE